MAANAQLNVANESIQQQPHLTMKLLDSEMLDDVPRADAWITINKIKQQAGACVVHQVPVLGTLLNTAPGCPGHAGGVGNAALQAQHADRELRGHTLILSAIRQGTELYNKLSTAPYVNGSDLYNYITHPGIVYLPPTTLSLIHI